MNTKTIIAKRIIALRNERNFSQQEVADAIGVSRPTYSDMERANREISALELKKLSDFFEVSMDNLLDTDWIEVGREVPISNEVTFNPQKLKTVLLYILEICGGKPNLGETVLYKLLYFIDFDMFDKYDSSVTGLSYVNQKFGPIPLQEQYNVVVKEMVDQGSLKIISQEYFGKMQKRYIALTNHELGVLDEKEKSLIDQVLSKLSHMSAAEIKEYVHLDIPWKCTKERDLIPYSLAYEREVPFAQRIRISDREDASGQDILSQLGKMSKEEREFYDNI